MDFPPFRPRPPWLGPDLQTLRNYFRPQAIVDLSGWPSQAFEFPTRDGSGDRLTGILNRPGVEPERPLVVLLHGLTGDVTSPYMQVSADNLLRLGHKVLRVNLRGAGASWQTCTRRYHAGRTDDLRDVLDGIAAHVPPSGAMAIGYSLGANILLKFLGEEGGQAPFRAAAAISAPIALAAASRRIMAPRNLGYQAYLLKRMRDEAFRANGDLDARARAAVREAKSVYEFDDRVVAPANGFTGAEDYYARSSAARLLGAIAVPTLLVHSLDDPWIPPDDYARFAWPSNPNLVPLLSPAGGHVGFHAAGSRLPWHDQCLTMFFASVLGQPSRLTLTESRVGSA